MLTLFTSDAPDCAAVDGSACQIIWNATGQTWLAESSDWLIVKPMRILIIIAVCLLVRGLVNRAIKRMTTTSDTKKAPSILRPFKERMPNLMADADTVALLGDRRRQRAGTIGSVLRSLVSWLVYAIMFMLVLAEFNVNLGPLLASAGVAGLAIGFGAQALVKDVISGLFMIMEDQYGVGDFVDLGEATGTVEVVGLRVTTIRDGHGTLWYVRNGEIIRVGNQSQSWANVILDVPIASSVDVDAASAAITEAVSGLAEDPEFQEWVLEPPDVQGVVDINVDASMFRVVVKTDSEKQWAIGRELRRRISTSLRMAGITDAMADSRVYVKRSSQPPTAAP